MYMLASILISDFPRFKIHIDLKIEISMCLLARLKLGCVCQYDLHHPDIVFCSHVWLVFACVLDIYTKLLWVMHTPRKLLFVSKKILVKYVVNRIYSTLRLNKHSCL